MAPILDIRLLGDFSLFYDAKPLTGVGTARLQSLLSYLLLHRDAPQSRSHLAFQFWPDSSEAQARSNLRTLLYRLRGGLPDASLFLEADTQTVQWQPDAPFALDVAEFEASLARAKSAQHGGDEGDELSALEGAVALYRGDLLPSCYDDWLLPQRERLLQAHLRALERLVELLKGQGQYDRAIRYAGRFVRHDPLREAGYRRLMQLHALKGDRSAALRVYENCARILQRELGVEPSPVTQKTYEGLVQPATRPTPATKTAPGIPPVIGHEDKDGQMEVPSPTARHNLPAHLTPFVGRGAELTQIENCLRDPAIRLLTLVGPGGIGKTRLALEAAEGCLEDYEHGVYQVRLAGVRSAQAIVPAVAQAIGFSFYEGGEPRQQLINYLRQKQMLLLVDNYEHLLDGVGVVADILRAAPTVTMLITSRIRLNLKGEQLFPVAGLAYPEVEAPGPMAEGRYDAMALFLAGARRVRPDFDPAGQEVQVGRICRLVQGMPLALLLAAAWAEMLPPAEIADRIAQGLDFLEADWQDVPERHRSIRAVLDHTWGMLGEREAELFQALSVFCGGFIEQAAQQVAGATLHDLRALVNRSLLHHAPSGRYEVHELLRQYAEDKLARSPAAAETAHDSHSAYYAAALGRWAEDLQGSRQLAALTEMDLEIDNAHAAWDWAVAQGRLVWLDQALDGLAGYYDWRARYEEAEMALQAAAEGLQAATTAGNLRVLARVLAWQGLITWKSGRTELANQRLERSLALLEDPRLADLDIRRETAFALCCSGYAVHDVDREAARDLCEQSVALYEALDDEYGLARALKILGEVIMQLGDYGQGRRLMESGLGHARAVGDQRTVAECLQWQSLVAVFRGQVEEAARTARESVDIYRAIGAQAELAFSLTMLAGSFLLHGQFDEARLHVLAAIQTYEELGLRHAYSAMPRGWLGLIEWGAGDYKQARQELQSTLALARETDWKRGVGMCLFALGALSLVEGAPEEALRLSEEGAASAQAIKQIDDYAWALAIMGYAECELGRIDPAREHLFEALRLSAKGGYNNPVVFALPGIAMLWASCGQAERAVELYALASGLPLASTFRWLEDTAGRQVAAAAATLPPETVAAAQARGRARDVKSTIAELLAELEGELSPAS